MLDVNGVNGVGWEAVAKYLQTINSSHVSGKVEYDLHDLLFISISMTYALTHCKNKKVAFGFF